MTTAQLERLARDLCWSEFHNPKIVGVTKLQYWKQITPDARADYRRLAREIMFYVKKLGAHRFEEAAQ